MLNPASRSISSIVGLAGVRAAVGESAGSGVLSAVIAESYRRWAVGQRCCCPVHKHPRCPQMMGGDLPEGGGANTRPTPLRVMVLLHAVGADHGDAGRVAGGVGGGGAQRDE